MKIDLNNYELFMLDYLDKNLDDQSLKEMEDFLLKHPCIAEELEDLDVFQITNEPSIELEDNFKAQLLQKEITPINDINESNYEEAFIAYHENDLEEDKTKKIDDFLSKNEFLRAEFEFYKNSKLKADTSIVFHGKETLKKSNKKVLLWRYGSAAAAMLLFGLWFLNPRPAIQTRYTFIAMESVQIAKIDFSSSTQLPSRNTSSPISILHEEPLEINSTREAIPHMASLQQELLIIEDQSWRKQMDLMQVMAFEKYAIHSQVDWKKLPSEKSKRGFSLVTSFLWKTTKASVQNISDEVFDRDFPSLASGNIEDISGGLISIKKPVKIKE